MAFSGNLLALGGTPFPMKWIEFDTYKVTPNRRQDLDPFRDANGLLHRNVVGHAPTTIDFELRSMYNKDVAAAMAFIKSKYESYEEKRLQITYYDPENDNYNTGTFYLDSNIEFPIKHIDVRRSLIKYDNINISFVEY